MATQLSSHTHISPASTIDVDTASSGVLRHLFRVVTLAAFADGQPVRVSESPDGSALFWREDGQTLSGRWVNRHVQPDPRKAVTA